MDKTEWTITESYWDYKVGNTLFTYDENEQEQNKINKNNAELVLTPKFIPLYPQLLQNWFSLIEAALFWFIDFFLDNTKNRFYCTNEQLAQLLNCSEHTISTAIKNLEKNGVIVLHKKIRAGGWVIRFITKWNLENAKIAFWEMWNLHWIYNKKIENKKIIINNNTEQSSENKIEPKIEILWLNNSTLVEEEKEKSSAKKEKEMQELWKREKIDYLINQIKSICDGMNIAYDKTMDRQFAKHILTAKEYGEFCEKIKQDRITFSLNVLIASIKINYWKWPLAWPKKIYQNYADLYNQAKQKAPKIQTPTINVL